ncbi:MAG: hypothetical protein JSV03_15555, partial [Planctomycetota bacterium]
MQLTAERRLSGVVILAAVLLTVAIVLTPIQYLPFVLLGVAGAATFFLWSVRGDLLAITLLWFVAVICFDEVFWRVEVPFFFNITISRLMIIVLVALWIMMWVVGRQVFIVYYDNMNTEPHESGRQIAKELARIRARYYPEGMPLDIVAHSMGG